MLATLTYGGNMHVYIIHMRYLGSNRMLSIKLSDTELTNSKEQSPSWEAKRTLS
jgi:hypothetical protein